MKLKNIEKKRNNFNFLKKESLPYIYIYRKPNLFGVVNLMIKNRIRDVIEMYTQQIGSLVWAKTGCACPHFIYHHQYSFQTVCLCKNKTQCPLKTEKSLGAIII